MSKTLKQMILNSIELADKETVEEIVKLSGYSSLGNLKKVLSDTSKEFENKLFGLVKVVRFLFKNDEVKLMSEYALTLDPNKQSARYMLEYLDINNREEKQVLIEKMLNCKNKDSVEWATVYNIDLQFINKEITSEEALAQYKVIKSKTKSVEIELITGIFSSYVYLDDKLFEYSYSVIKDIECKFEMIKEEYIRDILKARMCRIFAEYYIRNGELNKGREYCYYVINNIEDNVTKSWCLLLVGNSFIISDYDKANNFFEKGLNLSNISSRAITALKRSSNFNNNVWNKEPQYLDYESNKASDRHEIAYYLINKENFTEAYKLLEMDFDREHSHNTMGFHYYLKGMITNELTDYVESIKSFKKSGDSLFVKLPLMKLKTFGIPVSIIEALAE